MEDRVIKKANIYFHDEEARYFALRHDLRMEIEREFFAKVLSGFFASDDAPGRVLDIASGTGLVASALPAKPLVCVMTDISIGMLAGAKKVFGPDARMKFVACDAEKLPFNDRSFDVITCNAAMHHFPDTAAFIREFLRVLAPGGRAVLGFEANRRFWRNGIISVCYRLCQRMKPMEGGAAVPYSDIAAAVRARLKTEGLIKDDLSTGEMLSIVDIHSPNAGFGIDRSKGFDAAELIEGPLRGVRAEIVYHYEGLPLALKLTVKGLFPDRAPKFSVILKKGPA